MSNLTLTKSRFIHIPKCAGTYIQALIYPLVPNKERSTHPHCGHLCLHQMPETDHYNFTFVRHPYTWWPSYYYYMQKHMPSPVPSIDEWLRDEGPFWIGHYSTLVKRFIGEDEVYPTKNKMNFIGKSENLREDLKQALLNAGEIFNDARYNRLFDEEELSSKVKRWANTQEYSREISDTTKDLIHRGEKWIFDTFDYEQ
jgi:hypothetical protein